MRVAIIGTGYVGLVTGACLADLGHHVTCVDKNEAKTAQLAAGRIPIYEPGLSDIVARGTSAGLLHFTSDTQSAVAVAEAVFIAVGTPQSDVDGSADMCFYNSAADDVARALDGFTVVITKSTVPVGTGDALKARIRRRNPRADFAVVSNPEFLREGSAVADFQAPDRVVIGSDDPRAAQMMADLYRPLGRDIPLLFTDVRNAELIKYASNAFLALKIAFINEMADLCEAISGDVHEVARGMGLDPRIGGHFLTAGPGYGGSCFPKDTAALAHLSRKAGARLPLVETTIRSNARRKSSMAQKILKALGGDPRGCKVAVLGLTFKANTDDLRDSPALTIIPQLEEAGVTIAAHDPQGMAAARPLLRSVQYADDPYAAADGADALVILTEWSAFRELNLKRIKAQLAAPVIIDMRNMIAPERAAEAGLTLISIGRASSRNEKQEAHNDVRQSASGDHGWRRVPRLPSDGRTVGEGLPRDNRRQSFDRAAG